MIRVLVIVAIVSFMLAVGCFAVAFALAGGPFSIDDHWRFHRQDVAASTVGPEAMIAPVVRIQSN